MPTAVKTALAAALFLSVLWCLAPARGTDRREGVVEIRYTGPSGVVQGAFEDVIREFERLSEERHRVDPRYPRYRVISGQNASRNQTEDPTRFLVSVAGGLPPDVILFDRYAISEWAARGAFLPLDSRVAQDLASWDNWQAALATNRAALPPWPDGSLAGGDLGVVQPIRREAFYRSCWDEANFTHPVTGERRLYGIASSVDDRALFYNKGLLIRHGYTNALGQAQPPRTWEELEAMAVAMTERDTDGHIATIGYIPNYGNVWLYMYGWQAGGEFMSADGRVCTMNEPRIVEALTFMTRLYGRLGGTRNVYAFQTSFQGGELDPFIQGRVAMKVDGVWVLANLAQYGQDLDFGVAPAPLPARELAAGRRPITWIGGWAYAIPSTAKEPLGAWELIRFLSSERAQRIFNRSSHFASLSQGRLFMPGQSAQRAATIESYEKYARDNPALAPKFKEALSIFNDLLEEARYRPVTPVGQKLWNAHIWAMEDAIFGKKKPQQALDFYTAMVQADLDRILQPPPGRTIRSWRWFFWLYGMLLVLGAAGIYLWDVRPHWRPSAWVRRVLRKPTLPADAEVFRHPVRDVLIGAGFASPWIIGFIVFTGGPMLFSIVISFCRFDILNPAVVVGVGNYATLLHGDELFWKSLCNTAYMVLGIPLGLGLGLGLAILLNQQVRGVAVWRTFFYLPSIVPAVAASILWIWIFNPSSGLLNGMLQMVGITGPNWLQDEQTSKAALILMGLWSAGGGMIIWLAGLKSISRSYYEAAAIDGAGPVQCFWYITLPMLTPYIFFNLVMGLIGTFQIFTPAFIMTSGGPVNSTLFYAYHLFNNAFRYLNMGYAAAMAWFLFVIVVAITVVQMKLSKRWVHYEE